MFLASIYRCDYLAPLTSAGYGRSTRMARYPMNGARNLVSGSPGWNVAGGASEVNSWSTSESLLHSRQCELPFEISIFYAYTWETCRRTDAGRTGARTTTQFRLARRRFIYVRTVNTHSRGAFAEDQKLELLLSWLSVLSRPHLRLSSPSRADIIVLPRSCILGLYAAPCLREVASDLISRLVSFGADPLGLGPQLHL